MFIQGDDVIFSEVSPRPHDTGMVTMISQDMSEFALHARALLGLPVPEIRFYGPSASRAVVVEGDTDKVVFGNLEKALAEPGVQIRIFGKPEVVGHRRMAVITRHSRHRRGGSQKSRSCIRCPDHRNPASIGLATTLRHKAHRKSDALFFSPDVPLTRFQLKKMFL